MTGDDRETKVQVLAEAWASIDGRLQRFRDCKADPDLDSTDGYYSGYCAEAAELLKRLEVRGYTLGAASPEAAAAAQMTAGEG